MKCPHCGAEIPDSSKFCSNCGAKLEQDNTPSDTKEMTREEPDKPSQEKAESAISQKADGSEPKPFPGSALESDSSSDKADVTAERPAISQESNDSDAVAQGEPSESQNGAGNGDGKKPAVPTLAIPNSEGALSKAKKDAKSTGLKGKHPTWLLVLLCFLVPPVGLALLWKWGKPKAKAGKIVLTVVLALWTILYALTIVAVVVETSEYNQAIESFSTLDSTYKKNGVKLSYPGVWKDRKTSVSGVFPSTEAYVGFTFYTPSELSEDTSNYNLTYKNGFDSFADDVIATFNNTKGYRAKSLGATKVLKNAMYRKFSCKVHSTDGGYATGTMVLYADADGNVYGLYVYVGDKIGDYKSEADQLIDDVVSSVKFTSKDFDHNPSEDPIKSISASYTGDTEEGTTLDDSNSGIKVTATYADGTTKDLDSDAWGISSPQTLKAGQTATVTINAGKITTNLSVKCTTITEDQYKQSCQSISYDELLRNPDNYKGKNIKLRGKVFQSVDGMLLMNVTQGSYGIWDDATMVAWKGEPNVIEDDVITVWGTYTGTYTYTTALGADKTVPLVAGKYVSIE